MLSRSKPLTSSFLIILTSLFAASKGMAKALPEEYVYQRTQTIGLLLLLDQIMDQASGKTTYDLALAPKYGWNWGVWELGAQMSVSSTITNTLTSTSVSAGPFVDWNGIPNAQGDDFIPGIGLKASLGGKNESSSTPVVQTTSTIQAGPFVKQFLNHSSACIRFDFLYALTQNLPDNAPLNTATGPRVTGGLQVYY